VFTGTMASLPMELTEYVNESGGLSTSVIESAVSRRALLRLVGMFRPVSLVVQTETEPAAYAYPGCEVRYAVVRGTTNLGLSVYGPQTSPQLPYLDQPDLFLGGGLGSERIAWMRSFMLPYHADFVGGWETQMYYQLLSGLPWWQNNEMTIVDLKSKRRVNVESKMYLLRQVRVWDGHVAGDGGPYITAKLYHADYARLLVAG